MNFGFLADSPILINMTVVAIVVVVVGLMIRAKNPDSKGTRIKDKR